MKCVYVVTIDKTYKSFLFKSEEKAKKFCINYLYDNSTLEDRTNQKIEITEYSYCTTYSLYTTEYGDITLTIKELPNMHLCSISADGGNTYSEQWLSDEDIKVHREKHNYIVIKKGE